MEIFCFDWTHFLGPPHRKMDGNWELEVIWRNPVHQWWEDPWMFKHMQVRVFFCFHKLMCGQLSNISRKYLIRFRNVLQKQAFEWKVVHVRWVKEFYCKWVCEIKMDWLLLTTKQNGLGFCKRWKLIFFYHPGK